MRFTHAMVDRPASPAAIQQRLLRRFALLAFGYWRGPTRFKAWGFTIGLFLALLLNLAVAVAVNGWNKLFFDALQYKNEQRIVFSIFLVLVLAALVATHHLELAGRMDRRVTLRDGLVVELP